MRGVFYRKPFSNMNRNTLTKILSVVCVGAIFLAAAEYEDGSPGLWNCGCLAVALLSGLGLKKLEEKK